MVHITQQWWGYIRVKLFWAVWGGLLLATLLLLSLRFGLPQLNQYRTLVQDQIIQLSDQPVTMGEIQFQWHGWSPEFHVLDLHLLNQPQPDGTQPSLLSFDRATLKIDVMESLRQFSVVFSGLSVEGAAVLIERDGDGSFLIRDLDAAAAVGGDRGAAKNIAALFVWLSHQPRIELRRIDLSLYDRLQQYGPVQLQNLSLVLINSGDRHRINASLHWGDITTAKVQITADIEGDILASDWNGRLFTSAEQIPITWLLNALPINSNGQHRLLNALQMATAGLSFRAWGDWQGGEFQRLSGDASVVSPGAGANPWVPSVEANTRFHLRRHQQQWNLNCEPLSISVAGTAWPENQLLVTWSRDNRGIAVDGRLKRARLQGLETAITAWLSTAPAPAVDPHRLTAPPPLWKLNGELEDIRFRQRLGDDPNTSLRARFSDLNITAADKLQLQQANGLLEVNNEIALIALEAAVVDVDYPKLAIRAGKVKLQDLTGTIIAINSPASVDLKTPKLGFRIGTIRGYTDAQLILPWAPSSQSQSLQFLAPHLRVDLQLQQASYVDLKELIPIADYPYLQQWMDTALSSVEVEHARFRLHGHFSDPPAVWFDNLDASIQARADHILYYPDWPRVDRVTGVVTIRNKKLTLSAADGYFNTTRLHDFNAEIDDVTAEEPWLRISSRVNEIGNQIRSVLHNSPLRKQRLGFFLNQFELNGPVRLSLDMSIPLVRGESIVRGNVELIENRMRFPGHQQGLSNLNGHATFLYDGNVARITAQHITMRYLDKPIRLNIGSPHDRSEAIRITTTANINTDYVLKHIDNAGWPPETIAKVRRVLPYLHGSSAWQATLDIHQDLNDPTLATLSLHSDLLGLGLKLPLPFAKTSQQRRPSQINIRFTEVGPSQVQIRYADLVRGQFKVAANANGGMKVTYGSMLLGNKAVLAAGADWLDFNPSSGDGIHLSGRLANLNLSHWQEFLFSRRRLATDLSHPAEPSQPPDIASMTAPMVRSLDLDVDNLQWLNAAFPYTRIEARSDRDSDWRIKLSGEKLAGTVNVSVDPTATMVTATLDHIRLLHSTFPDTRIKAYPDRDSGWHIDVDGEKLTGTIDVPADSYQDPVRIHLDQIQLTTADDDQETDQAAPSDQDHAEDRTMPADLPKVVMKVRSLRLNTIDLGTLLLDFQHQTNDRISYTLSLDNDAFSITAGGDWKADGNTSATVLRGKIRANDLGALLARLGYDNQHSTGGVTNIALNLGWDGSPADVSLARLNGSMNLHIENGRLLQIKRGITARVFGLLSITALPQRLILNLSDLYEQGMRYKTINGHFTIKNDTACTRDLVLNSDIVNIELTGRVGLSTEDYQEIVTIIPRVTNSIPLIPIRLFEIIIGEDIVDPHFSYRYLVSGNWDGEPSIEPIGTSAESPLILPEPC